MLNYLMQILNPLPKPHSTWDFETNLLVLQILLKMKERIPNEETGTVSFMKELQDNLLKENINSTLYAVCEKHEEKHIGVVLDCAGAFWSSHGMDGIQKLLTHNNISTKTSINMIKLEFELLPLNNMENDEKEIFFKKIINLEELFMVEIYPTKFFRLEKPINVLYQPSSTFLQHIKSQERFQFDSQEKCFNTTINVSKLSSISHLSLENLQILIQKTINGAKKNLFGKELKDLLKFSKEDRRTAKNLFKEAPTHSFLLRQGGQYSILEVNLSNQKLQTDFLNLMGRRLEININGPLSENTWYKYMIKGNNIINLEGTKHPEDLFLNYQNWEQKIKKQYGINHYIELKPAKVSRMNKGMTLHTRECQETMAENPFLNELVKMENEYMIQQSLQNTPKSPLPPKQQRF